MTLPSLSTVNSLNTPNRSGHFYPNDGFIDQFLRKITFVKMKHSTTSFEFSRADSIPAVSFFTRSASLTLNPTNVTLNANDFQRVGSHLEMDNFDSFSGRGVDQFAQQVKGLKLSTLRQLSSQLIVGDGSTPNLEGFRDHAGTTIGADNNNANGGDLTLNDIYKAKNLCRPTDDFIGAGADCVIAHERTQRVILALCDNVGKRVDWQYDLDLGVRVPIIDGIPLYIDNSIPVDETKGTGERLSSMYFLKLRGPTAVRVLYAKDPAMGCDPFGIHVYDIPIKDTQDRKLRSVVAFYSIHIPETACIIRLDGINPPAI